MHKENVAIVMNFIKKNQGTAFTYEEIAENTKVKETTVRSIVRKNKTSLVRKKIEGRAYILWKRA